MILDNIIAIRILYLLVQPFEKSEAYKLGVIDANGNPLLKLANMTSEQKTNYTMLHRLVFRLKKVLGVLPFGKTTLASIGAAYLLVRESLENQVELENLEEVFETVRNEIQETLTESDQAFDDENILAAFSLLESIAGQMQSFGMMFDEGPVTGTGGLSGASPVIKRKPTRKVAIFDVDPETFTKFKKGKQKTEKWNGFLNLENETHSKVHEYIKKNPNGVLVLRCNETGSGQVVRYRKLKNA